jgi:hypothetical protein
MARIRNITPGFFDDEDLAKVSRDARLLFAGLWTQADREGRLEDRPERLRARLFPYEADIDPTRTDALLDDLAIHHFIVRYRVDGTALIQIRTFAKHQYVSKREPVSTLPAPPVPLPAQSQSSPRPVLDQAQTGTTDIGHRTTEVGQGTRDGGQPAGPARPMLIATGPERGVAFTGRVSVPASLHREFVRKLGTPDADDTLRAWYRQVDDAWQPTKHPEVIGQSDFAFWRDRFAEHWPPPAKRTPPGQPPVRPWYETCQHEPRCEKLIHHTLRLEQEKEGKL